VDLFQEKPPPSSSSTSSLSPAESGSSQTLDAIATVALDVARLLMESGANARSVDEIGKIVAHGLGAESADLRIGYASLALTIGVNQVNVTRMKNVGHIGVNQRLEQALWQQANSIAQKQRTPEEIGKELASLAAKTSRYSAWVTALSVGFACAAFGRLLGVDWRATGPVFLAAAIGQYIRHILVGSQLNVFVCTVVVSTVSSVLAGLGGRWTGSETIGLAVIASVLLLVPGVPSVNALTDVLESHPTLGSARAITVMMTLIFIAVGLWIGPGFLGLLK
jgi:uncharacterized membrane protein YjjP (DUF1212 family)